MKGIFFYNLSLFLISIACGLCILEIGIRIILPVFIPAGDVSYYYNSEGVPLGKKKSFGRVYLSSGDFDVIVHFNQYGFRDHHDIKHGREQDVFTVGDSFTYGQGVCEQERYSDLLEYILRIPVYNIAVPTHIRGYRRLVKYAEENGVPIKNLIIGICMDNDIIDYESPSVADVNLGSIWIQNLKFFLIRHSAAYNAIADIVHRNRFLRIRAKCMGLLSEKKTDNTALISSVQEVEHLAWKYNALIVIIPSGTLWMTQSVRGLLDSKESKRVHNEFVSALRQRNLNVVDLRSDFEESGNPLQYYFRHDMHWNKSGHAKVAEVIARYTRATNYFSVVKDTSYFYK